MWLKPRSTTLNNRASVYKRFNQIEISYGKIWYYTTADSKWWFFNSDSATFIETTSPSDYGNELSEKPKIVSVGTSYIFTFQNRYYKYSGGWTSVSLDTSIVWSTTVLYLFDSTYYIYNGDKNNPKLTVADYDNTKTIVELYANILYEIDHNRTDYTYCFVYNNGNVLTVKYDYYIANFLSSSFSNIGKVQTNKYYLYCTFDYTIRGTIEGQTIQTIKGNIVPISTLDIKYFDDNANLQVDDLVVIDNRLYSVSNLQNSPKWQPKKFLIYFCTLTSIL